MENSIYAKPIPRRKKIDMTSKSPLDDIQKMGEILLRHTSEKGKCIRKMVDVN